MHCCVWLYLRVKVVWCQIFELIEIDTALYWLSCGDDKNLQLRVFFTSICQLGGGKVKLVDIKPLVDNCGQKLLNWQFEIVFFSLKCIQIVKTRKWWYENTSKKAKGKY